MDEQHFSHEYRTGRSQPRHNNSSLITILLICVIFLAGLVSAMGLLNIRLFHQLNWAGRPDTPPISFTRGSSPCAADYAPAVTVEDMTFSEISALYGQVYGLPEGLYVCYVAPNSPAARAGILPGDVLTHVDNTHVTRLEQAEQLVYPSAKLELFRSGTKITLRIEAGI